MINLHKLALAFWYVRPGTFSAYLLAAALVTVATSVRFALGDALPGVQFITFFPAVIGTALICGTAAGFLAVGMAVACAWFFILPPAFSFKIEATGEIYALATFAVVASAYVIMATIIRATIDRIRRLNVTLTTLFDGSPDAVLLFDGRGRITNVNRRATELIGKSREDLIDSPLHSLLPERFHGRHASLHGAYMANPHPRAMGAGLNLFLLRGDGTEIPVDIQIGSAEIDGKTLAMATVRDLTEYKAMQTALEASRLQSAVLEERQRNAEEMRVWADAFQHAAIGIGIADPNTGIIRRVNSAYAAMRGLTVEEAEGMNIADAYTEEERQRLPAILAELDRTGHATYESRHLRKDGSTFPVQMDVVTMRDANGVPLYRVASSRDLTESKRTEEVLRHAMKMEAVGTLTGGMAHDFNNLLGVIILNLDVAQRLLPDSDRTKKLVVDALASARSGAALIRNLLAFARRQPLMAARVEINEVISRTHSLLSRALGEDIEIVLACAPGVWPVTADPSQVEASVMNLAANARDAMPKGGRLTIATSNQYLDADYAKLNPSVTPGDYAMIAVSDTGTGMTPEVAAKVFEPFFTTKQLGKGTGLGLSMVFGFAKQSGGHVSVHSKPGVGTTFRLFLPRAQDTAISSAPADAPTPVVTEQGHGETVLVVEDNAAMRAAVVGQLTSLNYRAIEADSALMALTVLETEKIDLVLSDVVMPGDMGGLELARQVLARWPSVRVRLTSGFSGNRISGQSDASEPPPRLLSKPYDLNQLAQAVRVALDMETPDPDQL